MKGKQYAAQRYDEFSIMSSSLNGQVTGTDNSWGQRNENLRGERERGIWGEKMREREKSYKEQVVRANIQIRFFHLLEEPVFFSQIIRSCPMTVY